jgi:hypothetical protein
VRRFAGLGRLWQKIIPLLVVVYFKKFSVVLSINRKKSEKEVHNVFKK